jgi:hypothetical protein
MVNSAFPNSRVSPEDMLGRLLSQTSSAHRPGGVGARMEHLHRKEGYVTGEVQRVHKDGSEPCSG